MKVVAALPGWKSITERYVLKANPRDKVPDPLQEAAKATGLPLALHQAGSLPWGYCHGDEQNKLPVSKRQSRCTGGIR